MSATTVENRFSASKIVGFEYLRVICAISVIAVHSWDTNISLSSLASFYLRFPVPLFVMMSSFFLFIKVKKTDNFVDYLKKRCARLIPAFLLWTCIYLAVRIVAGSNILLSGLSSVEYLFFGSAAVQLYYIPLILYYSILLFALVMMLKSKNSLLRYFAVVFFVLSATTSQVLVFEFKNAILNSELKTFAYYFGYNLIYGVLGVLIAYFLTISSNCFSKYKAEKIIFILMLVATGFIYFLFNKREILYFSANTLFFIVFYNLKLPRLPLVTTISKISFGIYLSHHLFIEFFQRIEQYLNLDTTKFNITIYNFLLSTVASIIFSFVLSKFSKTRFLVT